MLPRTEMLKRGNSIFLIFNSRYYLASNAAETNSDHVYFGGLKFPLTSGRTLAEEETAYIKRNAKLILQEAATIETHIKNNGVDELVKQLALASELNFFLKNIAGADNPLVKTTAYKPKELAQLPNEELSLEGMNIMPEVIPENTLVANARLYPLRQVDKPSIVYLGGRNYTLEKSKLTLTEVEKKFQDELIKELISRVIARSSKCREIHQAIENTNGENNQLINQLGVKVNPFSYESGREGLDISAKVIYSLVNGHYNHTTESSYVFGQSAATLSLDKGELATSARFAERPNANSPFVVSTRNHCFGNLKLQGTTLEDKMFYLREVANTIATQGGFYQRTTSSDDSSQ